MVQTVRLPDGTIRTFPDEATPEQIRVALSGIQQPIQQPQAPQQPTLRTEAPRVASQFTAGVADVLGSPVDAVSQALKTLGVIDPSVDPVGGSQSIQNLIRSFRGASGVEPETGLGQFAGGAARLAGGGGGGAALGGARTLSQFATQALLPAVTGQAGIEVARQVAPDSAAAEVAGLLAGSVAPGVLATGAGGALRRLLRGGDAAATQQTVQRAQELGVRQTLGDVAQGGAAAQIQSTLQKIPGGRRINQAITKTSDDLKLTVDRLTGGEQTAERAGRVIQQGITGESGFLARMSNKADRLFGKIDIDGATPVKVDNSTSILTELASPVTGLERTSAALANPAIKKIASSFAADIAETGTVPYGALRNLRSAIGRKLTSGSILDDAPRAELKRIYGAITDDLRTAATDAGKLKEFNRANDFWKASIKRVDEQLNNIVNKAEPEKVFNTALSGAKDGPTRLRALRKSITPEQWKVVAKTQLQKMGRQTPGKAGVEEGFSIDTFLTNYNRMAPASREAMFGGVDGLGKSLDTIARVVETSKLARQVGANVSGTASATSDTRLAILLSGGAIIEPKLLAVAGLISGGANVTARLFENPAFIKWVAQSTKVGPENLAAHIGRLSVVARQNPEIAEDIEEYVRSLQGAN